MESTIAARSLEHSTAVVSSITMASSRRSTFQTAQARSQSELMTRVTLSGITLEASEQPYPFLYEPDVFFFHDLAPIVGPLLGGIYLGQTGPSISNVGIVVSTASCRVEGCVGWFLLHSDVTFTTDFHVVPTPPADSTDTFATGINNHGEIVGWYGGFLHGPGTVEAVNEGGFLTSTSEVTSPGSFGAAFQEIDVPGASSTVPSGVNDAGQIIDTFQAAHGVGGGFLDSNGVFTKLNFDPTGINDRGQIVGGDNFIFTATPEPASLLLLGSGLATI
jgi:uncharacterized membrane protein